MFILNIGDIGQFGEDYFFPLSSHSGEIFMATQTIGVVETHSLSQISVVHKFCNIFHKYWHGAFNGMAVFICCHPLPCWIFHFSLSGTHPYGCWNIICPLRGFSQKWTHFDTLSHSWYFKPEFLLRLFVKQILLPSRLSYPKGVWITHS